MATAIAAGVLFGILGMIAAGGVAESCRASVNPNICAVFGGLLGAIFGAIAGGAGAVVDAIERNSPRAGEKSRWSSSRVLAIAFAVVILLAVAAAAFVILLSIPPR
jgi:hypothetical protein